MLIGCQEEKTDNNPQEILEIEVVNQAGVAVPTDASIDTLNPPIMSFSTSEIDFGTLVEGEEAVRPYYFINTGKSPLIITDAKASCGCTIPNYPDVPILPGESGHILVRFNSTHKKGLVTKTISIGANTFPQKINLIKLKVNVLEK